MEGEEIGQCMRKNYGLIQIGVTCPNLSSCGSEGRGDCSESMCLELYEPKSATFHICNMKEVDSREKYAWIANKCIPGD
jgi:hypothetical protein